MLLRKSSARDRLEQALQGISDKGGWPKYLVYLILAGQYENWITPVSILLSVPLALLVTILALSSLGLANNIYTQIGILLLIALAAKNAILIVEVAREQRELHQKSIIEAALMGAKIRFRPIIMTSFAFILGVMPLVFATGAGASARRSIGLAVSSGMLASTCLAVVFVPAFYVLKNSAGRGGQTHKLSS
jgi:HAE1 family hydrophobic/amphiphilic exporter-1